MTRSSSSNCDTHVRQGPGDCRHVRAAVTSLSTRRRAHTTQRAHQTGCAPPPPTWRPRINNHTPHLVLGLVQVLARLADEEVGHLLSHPDLRGNASSPRPLVKTARKRGEAAARRRPLGARVHAPPRACGGCAAWASTRTSSSPGATAHVQWCSTTRQVAARSGQAGGVRRDALRPGSCKRPCVQAQGPCVRASLPARRRWGTGAPRVC